MKKESLIERILSSFFYKNASGKAGKYAGNSVRMFELLREVALKMQVSGFKGGLSGVSGQLLTLLRLVRAYATGEYRAVSGKSIVSILAVLIYFVSPVDLIPDFLPGIGITDDVALVLWLFKSINEEIMRFGEWEKNSRGIEAR